MLSMVRLLGYSVSPAHVISIARLALPTFLFNATCRSMFLALRKMDFRFLALLVEVVITTSANLPAPFGLRRECSDNSPVAAKVAPVFVTVTIPNSRAHPVRPSVDLGLVIQTPRILLPVHPQCHE
jgi:hypothetical protein